MPSSKPSSARNELVGKAVWAKTRSSICVCHGLALLRFALARLFKRQKDVNWRDLSLFGMTLFADCEYLLDFSSGGRCRNGSLVCSSAGESKVSIRSLSCLLVVLAILVRFDRRQCILVTIAVVVNWKDIYVNNPDASFAYITMTFMMISLSKWSPCCLHYPNFQCCSSIWKLHWHN